MNRKCEQSVTTGERRTVTKVLGADKDKVHRDQTVGNNNKTPCWTAKVAFIRVKISSNVIIVIFMLPLS